MEFADGRYASHDERVMRMCFQLQSNERKRLYWCRKLLRRCRSVITKRRCSWQNFLLQLSISSFAKTRERGAFFFFPLPLRLSCQARVSRVSAPDRS